MKRNTGAFEQFLRKRIEEKGYPGVAVCVRGPEGILFEKGFGYRSMNKMNIEAIDWNYVHEYLCANDYDTGIHSLEWAEPILILNCCFDDPNAANNSDAFYAAVEDAATTVDDQERSDKLGVIQIEMLHPEWNMIPIYSDVYYVAHSSALKGVNILQNGFIYWNDLAL